MASEKTYTTEHVRVRFTVKEMDADSPPFLAFEPADGKASEAVKDAVSQMTLWLGGGTYEDAQDLAELLNSKVQTVGMMVEHDLTDKPS